MRREYRAREPVCDDSVLETQVAGVLGDFRIIREIGRGGMGIVYEAEQVSIGRRVALKVLPFAAMLDPKQLQRFKNEVHATGQLHHTNIVPVFSVGCERGVHSYAMQFIDGQTIAHVISELRRAAGLEQPTESVGNGLRAVPTGVPSNAGVDSSAPTRNATEGVPYSAELTTQGVVSLSTERSTKNPAYFRTVAQLGIQAAEALDHAHQVGIVHRDIKPSNLLLDVRGNLWITDFGLARFQAGPSLTMTGDLVGTLRYMSPEQASAQRIVVDHRTDIYSLGVTLYELLTLEPACKGRDRAEVLRQIAFDEPAPPRRLHKNIPPEVETIVLKAMEKDASSRYATAQELADDLECFLEHRPIKAKPPSVVQRVAKWARRHRPAVVATAIMVAVALALAAGSWGWIRFEDGARQAKINRAVVEAMNEAAGLRGRAELREMI